MTSISVVPYQVVGIFLFGCGFLRLNFIQNFNILSFIISFKYDIVGIDFLFRRGNVDVIRCGLFPSSLLQVYYYFGSRK